MTKCMLTYRQKTTISNELKNDSMIEKDRELLARHLPTSSLLHRPVTGTRSATLSFEIIYTLLEVTTKEDIVQNRKTVVTAPGKGGKGSSGKSGKGNKTKNKSGKNAKATTPKPASKPAPGDAPTPPAEEKKSSPRLKSTQTSDGKILTAQTSSEQSSSSATE